ncbi:MAG: nuclease [Caulobacter sp.]|nr:nuclease [Caulobacter sp.]
MAFFTYLLASSTAGTLYTGSADNLLGRLWVHREKVLPGFTATYGVTRLVWFEAHGSRHEAFRRKRQIKEWRRAWKVELIERENPPWADLYDSFFPASVLPDGLLADPSDTPHSAHPDDPKSGRRDERTGGA